MTDSTALKKLIFKCGLTALDLIDTTLECPWLKLATNGNTFRPCRQLITLF